MPFEETDSLLTDTEGDYGYKIPQRHNGNCLFSTWKSIWVASLFFLIVVILWISLFQPYNTVQVIPPSPNSTSQLLLLPFPPTSSASHLLKSVPKLPDSPPNQHLNHKPPPVLPLTTQKTYHYNFVITQGIISPDNFPQLGYLINGSPPPGPEIRIKRHSTLLVTITNSLPPNASSLTFHFHGIHQRQSFLSDGVPGVTQMPIQPGETFTHSFNTWPQVGTFFYHAHTGMDIVWLFGPMIIEDDPKAWKSLPESYQYDEERIFTLNGIYHESLPSLMERIVGREHAYPALTSSISINGRSYGDWQQNQKGAKNGTSGYYVTSIKSGQTYRLRFINAASDSLLSCRIDSHSLTVIEMDGVYVTPVKTDRLVLTPGQRYSLILKANQVLGNYALICSHMESSGPRNGIAYLHYEGSPWDEEEDNLLREDRPGALFLPMDRWIVDQLHPNPVLNQYQTDFYPVPAKIDKEFVVDVFEAVLPFSGQHVYTINGHYYEDPAIPYFMQLEQGLNITKAPQVVEIEEGDNVQIIFQNQRMAGFCFSHPWHIHGRSFHVVGEGPNRYDRIKDGQRIQADVTSGKKTQFMFRDSVTIYANQTEGEETDGAWCGWAAIRFSAHNPGLWLVHCHVTPHMVMGKKFVIWEHSKDDPYLKGLMTRGKGY